MQQLSLCHCSPPAPPAPWCWGVQGRAALCIPGQGPAMRLMPPKLLKAIAVGHFHTQSHYSFKHSSAHIFAFFRSPWGGLSRTRANWHPFRPNTWPPQARKKKHNNDFWANMGVCNNYHFAIAHPLHPLPPWGWGLQGVSLLVHPWAGAAMLLRPPSF